MYIMSRNLCNVIRKIQKSGRSNHELYIARPFALVVNAYNSCLKLLLPEDIEIQQQKINLNSVKIAWLLIIF